MKKIILFITAIALCCHFSHAQTDITKAVGKTNGYYSVSETGAAVYEIPIYTPAGTREMQPLLSLVYNSQSGVGIAGMGWNLKGLQCIVRRPQSIHIGEKAKNVRFNSDDLFAWNGNALIPIGGNKYKTELESFCLIESTGTNQDDPQGFTIYSKDGMLTKFNARDGAYAVGDNRTFVWNISSITDPDGNSISYAYEPNSASDNRGNCYISKITYAGGLNRIEFEYYTGQPYVTRYIHGQEIKCDKLLKKIKVISDNLTVRSYSFTYSLVKQNSYLSKITEYGKSDEELSSTGFEWTPDNADLSFHTRSDGAIPELVYNKGWRDDKHERFIADVNGDGREELIGIRDNQIHVVAYTPGGALNEYFSNPVGGLGTEMGSHVVADVNGDGMADVIRYTATGADVVLATGNYTYQQATTVWANSIGSPGTYTPKNNCFIADVNGDKRADILYIRPTGVDVFLSTGSSFEKADWHTSSTPGNLLPHTPATTSYLHNYIYSADINGDGLSDLVYFQPSGTEMSVFISTGEGFELRNIPVPSTNFVKNETEVLKMPFFMADINGDGLADMVSITDNGEGNANTGIWVAFSKGDGTFSSPVNWATEREMYDICSRQMAETSTPRIFADIDRDGLPEVFRPGNNVIHVGKNMGNRFSCQKYTIQGNFTSFNPNKHIRLIGDITGDGIADIVTLQEREVLFSVPTTDNALKIATVTDGFNTQVDFSYNQLDENSDPDNTIEIIRPTHGYNYPFHLFGKKISVVSSVSFHSDSLEYSNETFRYLNPIVHIHGKGFMGFIRSSSEDAVSGNSFRTEKELMQENAILLTKYQETYTGYTLVEKIQPTYETVSLTGKCFWLKKTQEETGYYLDRVLRRNTYVYDNDGNITRETRQVFSMGNNNVYATDITNITYANKGTWNFKPVSITDISYFNEMLTKTTNFTYNGHRLADKITNPADPTFKITERINSYDAFGNPTSISIIPGQGETRTTSYAYDAMGRFVTQETNPLGHITSYEYDVYSGKIKKLTDPNNLITSYTYDGLGNLSGITYPDGTTYGEQLHWAIGSRIPAAVYYLAKTGTARAPEFIFYDALNREVCNYTYSDVSGGENKYVDTRYNNKGQIIKKSLPYNSVRRVDNAKIWTEYSYDPFGRLIKEQGLKLHKTYTYAERKKTVTDVLNANAQYSEEYDPLGLLSKVTDPGGTILYTYGKHKLPTRIESNGAATLIEYDEWGNRISINESNSGVTTSTYDAFGQLTRQTDARGNFTTFAYDKLGRITQKYTGGSSTSEGSATYTYDNGIKAKGKVSGIAAANHTTAFVYDNLGRLSTQTENIFNTAYTTQYTYNANGQLQKLTYPGNFYVTYVYDDLGELKRIKNPQGNTLWMLDRKNTPGQATSYTWGNNRATIISYDELGNISSILSGTKTDPPEVITPGGPFGRMAPGSLQGPGYTDHSTIIALDGNYACSGNVQSWSYTYNSRGFLSKSAYGSQYESYGYDNLNRLTGISGSANMAVEYESSGNISRKSDMGDYSYNTKPNAVTQIEQQNIQNPLQPAPNQTAYTPFNRIQQITQGTATLNFAYGNDQQRIRTVKKSGNVILKTSVFVNSLYEKETVLTNNRELHYIRANGKLIGIYVKNATADTMYYVHTDRLGNYDVITDANGNIKERLSFDAWGNRRNPNNWAQTEAAGTAHIFSRGFTGHEHLDGFRVINMNARLYDPANGRFFSPDPFVVDPGKTQDFNRYSYCNNDPVNQTDLTGLWIDYYLNLATGLIERHKGSDNLIKKGLVHLAGDEATVGEIEDALTQKNYEFQKHWSYPFGFKVDTEMQYKGWELLQKGKALAFAFGVEATLGALGVLSATNTLLRETAMAKATNIAVETGTNAVAKTSINAVKEGRVFWSSGGNPAVKTAAESFATKNGMTTLEMTRAGQNLTNLTKKMTWAEQAPMWQRLSTRFATGAKGTVHVFHNAGGIGINSVWGIIEYPILRTNGVNIIYHIIP